MKDYILILPDTTFVQNIGIKSLAFFKLLPLDFEFISPHEFVRIKKLSVINLTCRTWRINDVLLSTMRNYINNLSNGVPDKKLYITRESAKSRKLLNESSVKDLVKDFGYEVIKYEDMQWEDQIKITSQAKSIVSVHGAGLTNMLFMPKSASVLEFRRNKIYHNQCFWHLASAINLKYFYLFGTPDNENLQLEGSGCNLTIDTNRLARILAQMETS